MWACPRRFSGETRTSCVEGVGGGVSDLRLTRVNCRFDYPFAPAEVVEFFREYCGPTTRAFATLEEADRAPSRGSRGFVVLPRPSQRTRPPDRRLGISRGRGRSCVRPAGRRSRVS